MRTKVLFLWLVLLAVLSCSKESDDAAGSDIASPTLKIANTTVAGDWWITEEQVGSQWVPTKNKSLLILTEDGFFRSDDIYGVGKFTLTESGVICYDDKDNVVVVCDFSMLNDTASVVRYSYPNGRAFDFKLKKNNPNSALCRNFTTCMQGKWAIENSENGGIVTIQGNGIAVIEDGDYRFAGSIERSERDLTTIYISGIYVIRPEQIDQSKHPVRFKIEGLPYMPSSGKEFVCVER